MKLFLYNGLVTLNDHRRKKPVYVLDFIKGDTVDADCIILLFTNIRHLIVK